MVCGLRVCALGSPFCCHWIPVKGRAGASTSSSAPPRVPFSGGASPHLHWQLPTQPSDSISSLLCALLLVDSRRKLEVLLHTFGGLCVAGRQHNSHPPPVLWLWSGILGHSSFKPSWYRMLPEPLAFNTLNQKLSSSLFVKGTCVKYS